MTSDGEQICGKIAILPEIDEAMGSRDKWNNNVLIRRCVAWAVKHLMDTVGNDSDTLNSIFQNREEVEHQLTMLAMQRLEIYSNAVDVMKMAGCYVYAMGPADRAKSMYRHVSNEVSNDSNEAGTELWGFLQQHLETVWGDLRNLMVLQNPYEEGLFSTPEIAPFVVANVCNEVSGSGLYYVEKGTMERVGGWTSGPPSMNTRQQTTKTKKQIMEILVKQTVKVDIWP